MSIRYQNYAHISHPVILSFGQDIQEMWLNVSQSVRETRRDESQSVPSQKNSSKQMGGRLNTVRIMTEFFSQVHKVACFRNKFELVIL